MPFEGSRRGHIDWARLRAALERPARGHAGDNDADSRAVRFVQRLDGAVLDLDAGRHRFERAARKSDHVDELRRALGVLLDILADWEQAAGRS